MYYKELTVWQKAMRLVEDVYRLTRKLPRAELYGLSAQMQRAAVSIPSNIAEGSKRGHKAEYVQFLSIAHGSAAELETQIELLKRLYPDISVSDAEIILDEILKMLYALIRTLKAK